MTPGASPSASPTFNKDVAPLLFKHCTGCHRPGEVAPFSLLSYAEVAKRSEQIVRVTHNRFMPPWKPKAGYGEFLDPRGLSEAEMAMLSDWAKAGAPEGDPADAPEAPRYTEGWQLGTPDLVLKMPEPYTLPAEGGDVYQCFVLPAKLAETRGISAIEIRPGNRKIVHHAILYADDKGLARQKDDKEPGQGYRCFGGPGFLPSGNLGGWAPGMTPRFLQEGTARRLPKGSDVIMQLHYHPSGKVETDVTQIGLYFSKKPPERFLAAVPLLNLDLEIPAGMDHHKTGAAFKLPMDLDVVGVVPHMHLLGQEMKVFATLPDGTVKPIIWIDDWDFNWQGEYGLKAPIHLPKGTQLQFEAVYDNSDKNPNNPHSPPKKVSWGENTTDEMAVAFVQFTTAHPVEDREVLRKELFFQFQLWRHLDKIGNQK